MRPAARVRCESGFQSVPGAPWLLLALGVLLLVVLALAVSLVAGIVVLAAFAAAAVAAWRLRAEEAPALSLEEDDQTPAAVADLPSNPTFAITTQGSGQSTPTGAIVRRLSLISRGVHRSARGCFRCNR